jgi:hypothetical protein
MKGTKILISGLVLAGVGTALFFVLKKSKDKSKKEFILSVYEKEGIDDDEYGIVSDGLDKMTSDELDAVYDFMVYVSNNEEEPQSVEHRASKVFDKYNFPK